MTDWDEHLGRIDRRTKTARRIISYIVLFLFVSVGLWTFVPMVCKESPPPIIRESRAAESYDSNSIIIENTAGSLIITSTGTGSDYITLTADGAGEDCIMIMSDAGGIDIDTATESIDITFDGATEGDEIIIDME